MRLEESDAKIGSLKGLQAKPNELALRISHNVDILRRLMSRLASDSSLAIIKYQLGIGTTNLATSQKPELPQAGEL